jgi:hypothetical protein
MFGRSFKDMPGCWWCNSSHHKASTCPAYHEFRSHVCQLEPTQALYACAEMCKERADSRVTYLASSSSKN